jgi:hypothetical protein
MALKRRLQDEDIAQELILESDCDAHIYLKMTFLLLKVTVMRTGQTQDAETGPTLYNLDLLHL